MSRQVSPSTAQVYGLLRGNRHPIPRRRLPGRQLVIPPAAMSPLICKPRCAGVGIR